jgi:hypothetical protein
MAAMIVMSAFTGCSETTEVTCLTPHGVSGLKEEAGLDDIVASILLGLTPHGVSGLKYN